MNDLVYFNSYEELSDYCYPFEKNLAHGISDEQRLILLNSIAKYYKQRLDEISKILGYQETMLVNVSRSVHYAGRCWVKWRIIELDVSLICMHPLALTEVIVHELTHYEQWGHTRSFYACMAKHIKKLGLKQQIEQCRQQEGKKSYTEIMERNKMLKKVFIFSTKCNLYPPIPNGNLLGFGSFQEFADFCAPPYKNLPRVSGLLDRIKILTYAEHYYRKIIIVLATRLQLECDFSKMEICITQKKLFIDDSEIVLPVWLIGLEKNVLLNLFVRLLTERQITDAVQLAAKVTENLSRLGIPKTHSTSIFLFDFFGSNWLNCFDRNGGKMMEYCL